MTIPAVSLVMPVYNGARYLESAMQSVLDQVYTDWELICVDDASTDDTGAILSRYSGIDPRVRHITNEKNLGLPATLNRGFNEASGNLHSWTSDDNILRPNMLSELVTALHDNREADLVYAGYSIIDEAGDIQRYVAPRPIEDRWYGNPVGASFLYRRSVTDALGGYDVNLFGAEDYDFWMRAARRFQMMPVQKDLYLYRRHGHSLTDQRSEEISRMVTGILLRELKYADDDELRAKALVQRILSDWNRFDLKLLAMAFKTHPTTVAKKFPRLAADFLRTKLRHIRP